MPILSDPVARYLHALRPERSAVMSEMEELAERDRIPIVHWETGRFLATLVRALDPALVLEVGTAIGYSTLHMAEALGRGRIVTIERDPTRAGQARDFLERAGVAEGVEIVEADALEAIAGLDGPFDLIFIDATKGEYPRYLELAEPKASERASLVIDNVLMSGSVAFADDVEVPDDFGGWWGTEQRQTARALNSELLQSKRWLGAVLPIGDGVAFAAGQMTNVTLRQPEPGDVEALAQIVFDAFGAIHDHHRFPRDFPTPEAATAMMSAWVPHPQVWGVVAEIDGRIVGSNFLDERDSIRGVGPITIDPETQNSGVGRRLMEAVIERGKDADGIRLVQDGFHMRSLSLYTSLGFDVTAACIVMSGKPRSGPVDGVQVRPLEESDLDRCAELCRKVHGFERTGSLRDAIHALQPYAAERDGRIVAYSAGPTFWPMSHGVAETEEDMKALLIGAAAQGDDPIALLVPLLSGLFRWGLEQGLRAVKPMSVMSMGSYQEPRGSWYPSVLY